MAQIVTMGEILVEIMATRVGQTFLEPGLLTGPYPSGAPAIFADQAALVGASVAMVACVGRDAFGELNIRRLRASGVDVDAILVLPDAVTGSAFVTYREDGSRDFVFNIAQSAAGRLRAEQLTPELFEGCRYFHVMGTSLINPELARAARRGVALAQAAGARVSFDPNIRKELLALPEVESTIRAVLAETQLLLPSEADLDWLHPGLDHDTAAERLLQGGIELVVLKKGAAGAVLYEPGRRLEQPAFPAQEVDPTGAGDCFGGTFLASLVQGMPAAEALAHATAAGALAVGQKGPMAGNAPRAALAAFIAAARAS